MDEPGAKPSAIGRPALYTPELAALVCERIALGESLRQVCKDESMPCTTTVMKWALQIPEFAQQYRDAREMLLEHWADETIEIADDGSNDWIERKKSDGASEIVCDVDHIKRSHLRVHTRFWHLSRLLPKKYGDRTQTELTGKDGTPLVFQVVNYASDPNTVSLPAAALSAAGPKSPR